ncbi:Cu(I)-responsive transcriptional regulator [Mesorhizobium sp. CC13]|uniref:Cu(I)-responsive transcriptional regulator n=1 Tax=Mesorhizobium sp. CC13 TaxID=3029194 RepID=UPI003266FDE3
MKIGQAARSSGLSAKTIRYYEETGLLPAARRTEAGYRVYDERDVHMLRFIHRAHRLGFSIGSIRQLLALWQDRNRRSAEVKELTLAHVAALDMKLLGLQSLKRTLEHLIACCEGDDRPDCPILEDLARQSGNDIASSIN